MLVSCSRHFGFQPKSMAVASIEIQRCTMTYIGSADQKQWQRKGQILSSKKDVVGLFGHGELRLLSQIV